MVKKGSGKIEYVGGASVFPEQCLVVRLAAGDRSQGFGVVDTRTTRYVPVAQMPDGRRVTRPTGRRQAVVLDQATGEIRAIDATGLDFLGVKKPALRPKGFHAKCRARGDYEASQVVRRGWRRTRRTARWPT